MTVLANKRFATGQSLTAVTVTPLTFAAGTGVITVGSATNYKGNFRDVRITPRANGRSIQSSANRGANYHITEDDFEVTLAGYVEDLTGVTAALPAPLMRLLSANDAFLISWTRAGEIISAYVMRGDADDSVTREESVESVTFKRIDVTGTANPSYTSAI